MRVTADEVKSGAVEFEESAEGLGARTRKPWEGGGEGRPWSAGSRASGT